MKRSTADIVNEFGPFPGVPNVGGVTYDGERIWFATGDGLLACDPDTGNAAGQLDVAAAQAGTAFDGEHLYQLVGDRIVKLDPHTGGVISSIPAPVGGQHSGLAWAEGTLWIGQHRERKILQVDPETG